jgi:steroid delta-isomerase-like uncharacterized protein
MPALLDEYAAAWSSGDPRRVADMCTDDCLYEDIPLQAANHGREEVAAFAAVAMRGIPDFRLELLAQVTAESWAAAEWRVTGTHDGDLPGMPRTGKPIDFRGACIIEIDRDKIKRCTDFWDMAGLRRQLGFEEA